MVGFTGGHPSGGAGGSTPSPLLSSLEDDPDDAIEVDRDVVVPPAVGGVVPAVGADPVELVAGVDVPVSVPAPAGSESTQAQGASATAASNVRMQTSFSGK